MAQVSILMPLHAPKREYLRAALACVFHQTYTDWKLILMNDPADRDVPAMIDDYLEDPRATFVQGETAKTIGENWNACLPYADTPFVQYLFDDDLWETAYLERSIHILETDPTIGFCAAAHAYRFEGEIENRAFYEAVHRLRAERLIDARNSKELLRWWLDRGLHPNVIGEPPFVLMRRSVMEKIGPFAEDLPQFLDSLYWAKLLAVTDFRFIPDSLGTFRVHTEGASARNRRAGRGLTDRLVALHRLSKHEDQKVASWARSALKRHLPRMIAKYVTRRKQGAAVAGAGGGVKQFLLRHPLLTVESLCRYLLQKKRYERENDQWESVS